MDLKKRSFPSSDWQDVALLLAAFESINQVKLDVRLTVEDRLGRGDLAVEAWATSRETGGADPTFLASASVSTLGSGLVSLESAVIHALYLLDAKMAEGEFAKVIKQP